MASPSSRSLPTYLRVEGLRDSNSIRLPTRLLLLRNTTTLHTLCAKALILRSPTLHSHLRPSSTLISTRSQALRLAHHPCSISVPLVTEVILRFSVRTTKGSFRAHPMA